MKTLEATEAKAKFSFVMEEVLSGEEFTIYNNGQEAVAVIVPYYAWKSTNKRKLGTLEKKGTVEFSENWHISDEELCNL
jgi:prevent-host-death family protein